MKVVLQGSVGSWLFVLRLGDPPLHAIPTIRVWRPSQRMFGWSGRLVHFWLEKKVEKST